MAVSSGRISIAVALVVLVFTSAASAHLINELTIGMAKHEDGPYAEMAPVVTVGHDARSFYFKATNNSSAPESITLTNGSVAAAGHRHDYRLRWYKGSHEVTSDAVGSGYDFNLGAGRSKIFRANVKPKVGNPGPLCLVAQFHENTPHVQDRPGLFYVNSSSICG